MTKVGLKPYWGTARPNPWPAKLLSGTPGTPGIPSATAAGGGAVIGVAPNAEASGLVVAAGAVQLGGTDNDPIEAALPKPADIVPPRPPNSPAPCSGPATALPSPLAAAPAASAACCPLPSKLRKGAIVLLGM